MEQLTLGKSSLVNKGQSRSTTLQNQLSPSVVKSKSSSVAKVNPLGYVWPHLSPID